MPNHKNITASLADAKEEIVRCAMYSYCGRIIYRKWDKKTKKFVKRSHVVVPIDCGVTSKKNKVLFAVDVEEGMQVKQFIINQILDFKGLDEKCKTAFPIQLKNIRKMLGIGNVEEEHGVAAGLNNVRVLVAKELRRIAQEVYEFSGCEGNLYSDRKKTDPCSYDVVYDDRRDEKEDGIARRVTAYLSESQKRLVQKYTDKRNKGMSFGDYFKWDSEGRCYMPLNIDLTVQDLSKMDDEDAKEILEVLDHEGFVCPDYATGYCYQKSDVTYSAKNPPKVMTVLRKALKNNRQLYERLSKKFEERKSGTLKRKGNVKLMICFTHAPEDVAGMSTDRGWESCMRLPFKEGEITKRELKHACANSEQYNICVDYFGLFGHPKMDLKDIAKKYQTSQEDIAHQADSVMNYLKRGGEYYTTALKQVKYGGMVAYLIRDDDKEIEKPLARLAIKRFENSDGGFLFDVESKVYGDTYVADSADFVNAVKREVSKSNETTMKGTGHYVRHDGGSWSDSRALTKNVNVTVDDLCKMNWSEIYQCIFKKECEKLDEKGLAKVIEAHKHINPPMGIFNLYIKRYGGFSDEFIHKYGTMFDVDLLRFENDEELEVRNPIDENEETPQDESEMLDVIFDEMEDRKWSDDYGDVERNNGEVSLNQSVNPYDIYDKEMDDIPDGLKNYVNNEVMSSLKMFYISNDNAMKTYPTFAEFEEAFTNGDIDEDVETDAVDYLFDNMYDSNVMYDATVKVEDFYDMEGGRMCFLLKSEITYSVNFGYGGENVIVGYENETIVNTADNGWKGKIANLVIDLYDQLPRFFY